MAVLSSGGGANDHEASPPASRTASVTGPLPVSAPVSAPVSGPVSAPVSGPVSVLGSVTVSTTRVEEVETAGEADEPVTFSRLGIDWPIAEDATEVTVHMGRIAKIENLHHAKHCKRLSLVSNMIAEIEGIEDLRELEEFELYQNRVTKIRNIDHLVRLRVLDLAFNEIRRIENLDSLIDLEKLYLSSNKITKIEGLTNLRKLSMLELGSNRIRVIENIENLKQLRELWLARNKLTAMNVPPLPELELLSLQNNRLEAWDEHLFENCPALTGLYLGENRLPAPPASIKQMPLTVLDLSKNVVADLTTIATIDTLEELWLNDNAVGNLEEVAKLKSLPRLETLYLERNPLQADLGPAYRPSILQLLPHLKQLDAIVRSP